VLQARPKSLFVGATAIGTTRSGVVTVTNVGVDPRQVAPLALTGVWIDRNDGLVRRIEIEETSGQHRTLVLDKLAVNRGVPGREFTFSPPAGLRVVDQ